MLTPMPVDIILASKSQTALLVIATDLKGQFWSFIWNIPSTFWATGWKWLLLRAPRSPATRSSMLSNAMSPENRSAALTDMR